MGGSKWFRRLKKDCKKISPYIRFVRIHHNFFRVYYKQAYVHEVYREMPQYGHDIYEKDVRFISQKYYEEYEDRATMTNKIKNYREGYWDSLDRIRTRVWMMKHDNEYYQQAKRRYQTAVIK